MPRVKSEPEKLDYSSGGLVHCMKKKNYTTRLTTANSTKFENTRERVITPHSGHVYRKDRESLNYWARALRKSPVGPRRSVYFVSLSMGLIWTAL